MKYGIWLDTVPNSVPKNCVKTKTAQKNKKKRRERIVIFHRKKILNLKSIEYSIFAIFLRQVFLHKKGRLSIALGGHARQTEGKKLNLLLPAFKRK